MRRFRGAEGSFFGVLGGVGCCNFTMHMSSQVGSLVM